MRAVGYMRAARNCYVGVRLLVVGDCVCLRRGDGMEQVSIVVLAETDEMVKLCPADKVGTWEQKNYEDWYRK